MFASGEVSPADERIMPSRRQFLATAGAALTGETVARMQRPRQPAATSRFHDLRRGVGYFTGPGGTIGWLATPDGAAVIDTQFPETAKLCVDGLRSRSARGIGVLINTHHHGDHTAGNTTFRPAVRQNRPARALRQDAPGRRAGRRRRRTERAR